MPAFVLVDGPLLAGGDGVVPSPSTAVKLVVRFTVA